MDIDRARAACARRCKHLHCTGLGHLTRWSHRCQLVDITVPAPPCGVADCGVESVGLLPAGRRCAAHLPPQPDPSASVDQLRGQLRVVREYGEATTDPLGRTGPLNQYRIPTRGQP